MKTKITKLIILLAVVLILSGCKIEMQSGTTNGEEKSIETKIEVRPIYEYYTIKGTTSYELYLQLQKLGPKATVSKATGKKIKPIANMQMTIERHYQAKETSKSCKLINIKSVAIPTFVYPQWERPENPLKATVEAWEKMIKNLKIHEVGHKDIAMKGVTEMQQVLESVPAYPTCDELKKVTDEKADEIDNKYVEMNKQYDKDTEHGIKQGVTLQ